jgi:hypothetical protein
MKQILSIATLFALVLSLSMAQAQQHPKTAVKKEKAGCCSETAKASTECKDKSAKECDMSKKDCCADKKSASMSKKSCDMSRCGDECKDKATSKAKTSTDKKI